MKKTNKRFGRVLGLVLVFAMMFSVGSVYAGDGDEAEQKAPRASAVCSYCYSYMTLTNSYYNRVGPIDAGQCRLGLPHRDQQVKGNVTDFYTCGNCTRTYSTTYVTYGPVECP